MLQKSQLKSTLAVGIFLGMSLPWPTPSAASKLQPFENNSIITGQVIQTPDCGLTTDPRPPVVWLARGQALLFQVEVPVQGDFEFHVIPGKYDLLVTRSGGCMGQTEVSVKPKQVLHTQLRLASSSSPKPKAEAK